ncbi:hypothetical protein HV819_07690 [Anaerococcus sp. AGMB00486]|uniref:Uncharacterized protein n=1 Tax=Anaerococcus faecalis TaxID=2742993 RepID=A0ABX2NB13_9FIRM|nr:hypothetical protein [Anaerococcus faecalis]NVF11859.1 hypothetical protein [Anaerococcus faecalis]
MKSDREKLLDMFDVFEDAIKGVEDIGEFEDYDLDQKIEEIYNKLEDLSIDVWGLIRERGWSDE